MERVTRFQTADGVLHDNFARAVRHADDRYGCALTTMAHKLVKVEKYGAMIEFLEANLNDFAAIIALHEDIKLTNPEED